MPGELMNLRGAHLKLLVQMPQIPVTNASVLIVVHGIAREQKKIFDAFASSVPPNMAIIAPVFDNLQFPHYQKLGIKHFERRADFELDCALNDLSTRTGLETNRFDLFGFSGGAQFAHRYALLNSGRVRSLHVSSSGYYTFLDDAPWPRGLRRWPDQKRVIAQLPHFLRQQINVYVGENDLIRDANFRTNERIDAQQGCNRVERAKNWVHHVGQMQRELNLPTATLTLLPDTTHEFEKAVLPQNGDLVHRVLCTIANSKEKSQRRNLENTISSMEPTLV